MIIGVPKEIKNNEFRVGMIPSNVKELVKQGHQVLVETQAASEIGFSDDDYRQAGADILASAQEIFAQAEMIVKVKEPQASECALLRPKQILFTYLHLAADVELTQKLLDSQAICIAYETVEDSQGHLPLLAPMSEVAGRLAIQAGATHLQKNHQGRGILLGGVPGVEPAKVVILGGGSVGRNAAKIALGIGAEVIVLDKNIDVLRAIDAQFSGQIKTLFASSDNLHRQIVTADLLIGAVLIPGASAPKLVSKEQIKQMKSGAVIVDVAIDQGGCIETSRPTSHQQPTFIEEGVVHYCVTNMPGAVPHTSALALNHATLPYIIQIANQGYRKALLEDSGLLKGLNLYQGQITCSALAQSLNRLAVDSQKMLEI